MRSKIQVIENKAILKNLVLSGNFLEARNILPALEKMELSPILLEIGYDQKSICSYAFVCFLMLKQETVAYHCLASEILINAFPDLIGSYKTALYHIRRSIELCPDDVELAEMLLFFNTLPEKLVDDVEAQKVALYVLTKKSDSSPAKRILKQ